MFTWICPRCGREVLPSYTECPDCKGLEKQPEPAVQAAPPPPQPAYQPPPPPQPMYQAPPAQQPVYQTAPPQQPAYQAPPPGYQQQPPAYQPPQGYPPQQAYAPPQAYPPQYPPRRGGALHLPTWLLTVLFALAFLGLVAGVYWGVGSLRGGSGSTAAAPAANVESPAAKPGAKTNPVQKYIEISGIRFTEDAKKRILVKFSLTNHSDADLSGLAGNVTMWGRTQKSEEEAVGTFSFATDVGPQVTKEVSAPLTTKLRIYELPDWQNVTTDLQITAPAQ
jgi:hypothetical protein